MTPPSQTTPRVAIRLVATLALSSLVVACGGPLTAPQSPDSQLPDDGSDASPEANVPEDATPVPPDVVDTLFHSSMSGLAEATRVLVDTPETWADAWARLTDWTVPIPERPEVDFDAARVAIVGLGERPTGGYEIEIPDVRRTSDRLFVTVREVRPGATCIVTQAVTRPATVLQLPRSGEEVVFVEEVEDRSCD